MGKKIKILILEDSPVDVEMNLYALKTAGVIITPKIVDNKADYISAIQKFKPEIILADYNLPSFNGIEALDYILDNGIIIPFIFVSGVIGEETAIEAVKHGATDYVMKKNLLRLGPSVTRALKEYGERRKKEEAEEALRKNEVKYRTLAENLPDIIARFDCDLRYIYVNQAVSKLYGLPPKAFLGKTSERTRNVGKKRRNLESGNAPGISNI